MAAQKKTKEDVLRKREEEDTDKQDIKIKKEFYGQQSVFGTVEGSCIGQGVFQANDSNEILLYIHLYKF